MKSYNFFPKELITYIAGLFVAPIWTVLPELIWIILAVVVYIIIDLIFKNDTKN